MVSLILVFIIVITLLIFYRYHTIPTSENLYIVHIICTHGEVTPKHSHSRAIVLNNTFYPGGFSQLTQKGKLQMYNLGITLRRRYGQFLGKYYMPFRVRAMSSSFDRTQMSAQLILAGMFPPRPLETWNSELPWQPIPVESVPPKYDYIFLPLCACKRLAHLKDQIVCGTAKEIEYQRAVSKQPPECGEEIPCWSQDPDIMREHYTPFWDHLTTEMTKLTAGFLFNKIIEDTRNKISGKAEYKDMKFFLYVGHSVNIIPMLTLLDAYDEVSKAYGAYLAIEMHKAGDKYVVKVFHQNDTDPKSIEIDIKKCWDKCTLDDFFIAHKEFIAFQRDCDM